MAHRTRYNTRFRKHGWFFHLGSRTTPPNGTGMHDMSTCKIRTRAAQILTQYERTNTVGVTEDDYEFIARPQDNYSGWWTVRETTPDGVGYTTAPDKRGAQWIVALDVAVHLDGIKCNCEEWCR